VILEKSFKGKVDAKQTDDERTKDVSPCHKLTWPFDSGELKMINDLKLGMR